MEKETQVLLARLLRESRIGSLGTLRSGAPEVSLVLVAVSTDFASFYIHITRLAHHTQNIVRDSRTSIMITEPGTPDRNPQTLARVSVQGEAALLPESSAEYAGAKATYLQRFPKAAMMFGLGDFALYRIEPQTARFVAGFAQAYNLTIRDFREASSAD